VSSASPGSARRRGVDASSAGWVRPAPDGGLPLLVTPLVGVDLSDWAKENAGILDGWLDRHGAVLFSGFATEAATGPGGLAPDWFARVSAGLLQSPLAPYQERSSPRRELASGVFTSTEQPPDQPILLHNENAYQRSLPTRLVFGCAVAARHGGATPLADCRRVLALLPATVVDRFRSVGVRYTRVFGTGVGLTWQEAFSTTDRDDVDQYCAAEGIESRWCAGGVLRTVQVRPALTKHPRTGEEVWVNHVGLFGPYGTTPAVRAALLSSVGSDDLPLQVAYGDGQPIEAEVHDQVREAYAAATMTRRWQTGDLLVVDNLLVAHGREPYEGDRLLMVSMAGGHEPAAVRF